MTYSLDLRKRAIALLDEGKTKAEVAALFNLNRVTLHRWLKRKTQAPKKQRNSTPRKLSLKALEAHVAAYPDAFQYERAEAFGVSRFVVLHRLKRLGLKKNATVPREGRQASQ